MPESDRDPAAQLAPVGPHPTDPARNALGRWASGNDGHLVAGGLYSEKRSAAFDGVLHEQFLRALADKGLTEAEASVAMKSTAKGLIHADALMQSFFDYLMRDGVGPISPKGRTRRAVDGWMRAADRVAKFSAMLGLDRRPRTIHQTTAEWLDSLEDQQRGTHDDGHERAHEHDADSDQETAPTAPTAPSTSGTLHAPTLDASAGDSDRTRSDD